MFSEISVRPTYQMTESTPMTIVETLGVRYRGWTVPNVAGIAFARAMDSDVLAVGRIVVWVDADADDSTAMIRSLSNGEPKTSLPRTLSTSSALSISSLGPA